MEESTPIFDALWEKYNSTPIFDQVVRQHEEKKYQELVEPYQPTPWALWCPYPRPEVDMSQLFPDKPDITITNEMRYRWANMVVKVIAERNKEKELMNNPNWQDMVNEFRKAMDLPVADGPRTLSTEEQQLHIKLIRDEFEKELVPAIMDNDLIEIYDAGIDVIYFVIGLLSNAGMQIDPGFIEVHRSNMSKMDPVTGKAIKAGPNDPSGEPEGKVLKGPNYFVPNLGIILNEQTRFGHEDVAVYKNLKVPITLGVGGPKIGEGQLNMDNQGNVMMEGVMDDVSILPVIDHLGFSVSGVSIGDDDVEEIEVRTYSDHHIAAPYDR